MVTDRSANETAYLAKIDPNTWEIEKILNNHFERPFIDFNDIEIDSLGNFYLTDSRSAIVSVLGITAMVPIATNTLRVEISYRGTHKHHQQSPL